MKKWHAKIGFIGLSLGFFVSGATALILEVTWTKQLSYVVGVSYQAGVAVISAYMLGMGLGSWLISRSRMGKQHPSRSYGALQFLIGCFGLASLFLFAQVEVIFSAIYPMFVQLPFAFNLVRFVLLLLLLAIPTTLMGMTLPLL